MVRTGVVIEPLDVLFFRGGRPFLAGLSGESGLPAPQVLAGFVRTLLLKRAGANFSAMRGKKSAAEAFEAAGAGWLARVAVRGPFLCRMRGQEAEPIVRAPTDLALDGSGVIRLSPLKRPLPGWSPPADGMKPLWSARGRPPKERPEWLTWEGLKAWARGEEVKAQHTARSQDLYALEERTGIEIDPASWSAKESLIYTTRKIRLKRGIAFYAEVVLPEEKEALLPGETAEPWGGERHYVRMSRVRAVEWPHAQGGNITLALLTPAFCGGWRPRALAGAALAAAAVDGPFSVSGWDFANGGPKPARFGIDAGSVFLLEGGGVLPESLTDSSEDALAGYGMYVKGTWNYVE